jgi:hypothetical protein
LKTRKERRDGAIAGEVGIASGQSKIAICSGLP